MREDIKKVLCDLQERAAKDIRKLLDGKPDFSPTEWKTVGDAVDIIKDVETSIKDALTAAAMEDEYGNEWEEMGESARGNMRNYRRSMTDYYPMGDMTFTNRRNVRSSYNGRSSYNNAPDATIANLRNLMNNASNENERMMYQRFIDEAESMR